MLLLVAFVAFLVASNAHAQLHPRPRQATSPVSLSTPTSSSSSSSSSSSLRASSSGSSIASLSGVPSGSVTPTPTNSSPPTFPVTLLSTNPTAIPLSSLVPNASVQATVPLSTTYAAGATPTAVTGAPPLPDISTLNPANYPALDKPPPVDSPEVQEWIAQINASGYSIPNISVNSIGGCSANPAAVADSSRCWWTCSQCTRSTDIITCPTRDTWGSSFDDGPSPYTPSLLQYLDQQNLKTTFFVVGSRVISRPDHLRTQYMGGHQIAVHTWSHTSLTTQSTEEVIAEFGWSKKVIKDVIGITPTFYRPPFGDIDDRIRAIGVAMGLSPVIWTSGTVSNHVSFDTNDFYIDSGLVSASGVIDSFNNILGNATNLPSGFIVLEHDLFQQSVDLATGYILPQALAMKLTIKPIISCLDLPLSDAYVETNNNITNPRPSAVGTSIVAGAASTQSAGAGGSAGASSGNGASAVGVSYPIFAAAQVLALSVLGALAAL